MLKLKKKFARPFVALFDPMSFYPLSHFWPCVVWPFVVWPYVGESWNLDKFPIIFVNFEGEKMVDHILEIPRLVNFGVKRFNCEYEIPAWNKYDVEVVI